MFTRVAVLAMTFVASVGATVINKDTEMRSDGDAVRNLMSKARRVQENENQAGEVDTSFLSSYSVKFQGCHHVQQWNDEADNEDDVKIKTERLVRFRLCPSTDCNSDLTGCSSNYGDYVVDMETYLSAYSQQMYGGDARKLQQGEYGGCQQVDFRRELQENGNVYGNYYANENVNYFVGPYCANQGGEIQMGVFLDDTCSVFAENGAALYAAKTGSQIGGQSLVSTSCMSCGSYGATSEFCSEIYALSGKCESKMQTQWGNEGSCSYIEGIKVIREDGVIRSGSTNKSKAAAVAIGMFLTIAVLLAGYVYYLRTKLSRAQINLSAGSETLA